MTEQIQGAQPAPKVTHTAMTIEEIRGEFEGDLTAYYPHADLSWDAQAESYRDAWVHAAFCGWQVRPKCNVFLVRDIAELTGVPAPALCLLLNKKLGRCFSVNTEVDPEEILKVAPILKQRGGPVDVYSCLEPGKAEQDSDNGLALWQLVYAAIAHVPLDLKVAEIEDAAHRVAEMLERRANEPNTSTVAPIGTVSLLETDEDGQASAWVQLNNPVELGDALYTAAAMLAASPRKPTDPKAAEVWLRQRYGAYRGHFAWRELEEAFNAGAHIGVSEMLSKFRADQIDAGIPDEDLMPTDPAEAVAWLIRAIPEWR